MNVTINRAALLAATTLVGLTTPVSAFAQEAATPTARALTDEIVVTARRREERQQDVPLAVSALSSAQLERAGISNVNDLQGSVPNLIIAPGQGSGGRDAPVFAIRGMSQQDVTSLADPSVSLYVNDVIVPRTIGANTSLFDIGSVQVLRGPQGTLFGRNTTGGAIVISTREPSPEFGGYLTQTIGDNNAYTTEAAINVPLGEFVSFRLAGQHQERDGFVTDVVNGRTMDDVDQDGLRLSINVQPASTVESLFIFDSATTNNGASSAYARPGSTGGAAQRTRDYFHTASGMPVHSEIDIFSATNRTSWDINDNLTVRNIVGYREMQVDLLIDSDGSSAFLLPIGRYSTQDQISEEFQVLGEAGWGNWIAGLYYFRERAHDDGLSTGAFGGCGSIAENYAIRDLRDYSCYSNTATTAENTSKAIFAQATFDLWMEGLTATIGVRQNWDKREAVILNHSVNLPTTPFFCRFTLDHDDNSSTPEVRPTTPAACALPLSASFNEPTYNLSLEYRANADLLYYIAHRHGYRTGGFGARSRTEQGLRRTFEPEIVNDIEIGVKADWRPGDAFLRTNLALFYADYKDIQRLLSDPSLTPPETVTTNAGEARVQGVELEFIFRPFDWLEFSGFHAFTDAEFTEFIAPNGADLSVNPFARTPENISNLKVRVDLPVPADMGDANVGVSYFHQDAHSTNDSFIPGVTVNEAQDIVDLVAEWNNIMGSRASVSVFVDNAFDNEYGTQLLGLGATTINSAIPGDPRTYGVRLRYKWGGE